MLSTLIKIGPITVHSYGLLIGIGFLVAVCMMRRDARMRGINPDLITDLAFWALFLGVIGTRILHIVMFPREYSWSDPVGWIAIWRGGLVFQGALLPVILLTIFFCRKHHLPLWRMADIICPYIPLGHAFGRMGCFMHGCCFGKPADVPWAVSFPAGSPAYELHQQLGLLEADATRSLAVHPTQLYSAMALIAMSFFIKYSRDVWRPVDGSTFPFYLVLYGTFRFFVEFLRGDYNPQHFGILSDQQVFCLIGIVAGIIVYLFLLHRSKRTAQSRHPS